MSFLLSNAITDKSDQDKKDSSGIKSGEESSIDVSLPSFTFSFPDTNPNNTDDGAHLDECNDTTSRDLINSPIQAPTQSVPSVVYITGEENEDRIGQWSASLYVCFQKAAELPIKPAQDDSGKAATGEHATETSAAAATMAAATTGELKKNTPSRACWGNVGGCGGTLRLLKDRTSGVSRLVYRDRWTKSVRFNRRIRAPDTLSMELDGEAEQEIAETQGELKTSNGCMIRSHHIEGNEKIVWTFDSASDCANFVRLWKIAQQTAATLAIAAATPPTSAGGATTSAATGTEIVIPNTIAQIATAIASADVGGVASATDVDLLISKLSINVNGVKLSS